MPEWFLRAFGAAVGEFGNAISDTRSKLIEEAWFGRKMPEPSGRLWPGSSLDREGDKRGLLDRLFETDPEHFVRAAEQPGHDPDHGIDR